MRIAYLIVERCDSTQPSWLMGWPEYVRSWKLSHVTEMVSVASPPVVVVPLEHEGYPDHVLADTCDDWRYALTRIPAGTNRQRLQILAVLREPTETEVRDLAPEGFEFVGFDLLDQGGRISSLSDCVGFDAVLLFADLNRYGLLPDLATAYDIRERLAETYPDDEDADCVVWAVWRKAVPS